jgi:predicted SAM-dependent methyltransferase
MIHVNRRKMNKREEERGERELIKLHVGCGKRILQGWIHIDIQEFDHIDHVIDLKDISNIFKENSVDEIYACHVIEHISRHEINTLFESFFKILKPGGILRLAVPDIGKTIQLYNEGVPLFPTLYGQFWGGQKNVADFHTIGFDLRTMSNHLANHGFYKIERYDWRDFLPSDYDDYSRSYFPHMDFDHGTLMSLNVVASKPTTDQKKIIAFCTGGLCNALDNLINATILAKKLDRSLCVYWIEGYIANDIGLNDLLDVHNQTEGGLLVKQLTMEEYMKLCTKTQDMLRFCSVDIPDFNDNPNPGSHVRLHQFGSIDEIQTASANKDIFICEPIIPAYFDPIENCKLFFETFQIKKSHLKTIGAFKDNHHGITYGIHVRGTDLLSISGQTLNDIKKFVDDKITKHGKLFICSDDENVEGAYRDHPFVAMHYKSAYVTRRDESQSWFADAGNDHFNAEPLIKGLKKYSSYNVVRTKEQVLSGWIDLLTLSQMQKIDGFVTSQTSTYYALARTLQAHFQKYLMDSSSQIKSCQCKQNKTKIM